MSFSDDAREDRSLIDSACELTAMIERVRELREKIEETARRRRSAGSSEPRSLGG